VHAFLEHVVHDSLGPDVLAQLTGQLAGEDHGRHLAGQSQINHLAIGGVRQVQVQKRSRERLCSGFQDTLAFLVGFGPDAVTAGFTLDHSLEQRPERLAVVNDQYGAHCVDSLDDGCELAQLRQFTPGDEMCCEAYHCAQKKDTAP